MIEIIREEEWEKDSKKRKTLPKDIRQIGRPDAGDRIYVENQAYQFLRSGNQAEEKTAYVLLGRFEEFDGKWCTFVEAAICLEEMKFEGNLPIWTDHTWAYIFKNLNKDHDDMAIAGCAIDIRGSLPEMNVKLEAIHQKNFGGPHQVMLLLDTLEREELFYANYNGRLYRKDGFYIYYDRNLPENMRLNVQEQKKKEATEEEPIPEEAETFEPVTRYAVSKKTKQKGKRKKDSRQKAAVNSQTPIKEAERQNTKHTEHTEQKQDKLAAEVTEQETAKADAWEIKEPAALGSKTAQSGQYRERLKAKSKRLTIPSYVPSAALVAIVCLMGFAAFQNQRKMNRMQEALVQSDAEAGQKDTERDDYTDGIKVEQVAGNVQPQEAQTVGANTSLDMQTAEQDDEVQNTGEMQPENAVVDVSAEQLATEEAESGEENKDAADTQQQNEDDGSQDGDLSKTQTTETEASEITEATETSDAMAEAKSYLAQGYYIVQKGDSLVGICRKIYQTTAMLDKLCEVNNIEDRDAIYAGQYLTLPN